MAQARNRGPRWTLLLVAVACALTCAGCRIDILRIRSGNPLDKRGYEALEVAKTTRNETLDRLGAPEKVEWKNGLDYVWYLYEDTVDTGIRFQFPPFRSVFGYQHTFLRMSEKAEDVNAMELIFDDKGVLQQKSLRLSNAYEAPVEGGRTWLLNLEAHGGHSILLFGDGGVRDFKDMFDNGFRTGLTLGFQPVPVVTLLLAGNFLEFQGDSTISNGRRINFDDLRLYQAEIGVRLEAPLSLLFEFTDFENVERVLFAEELGKPQGFLIYVQATTGGTWNESVPVKIDDVSDGRLFDRGVGFSYTLETGLGYSWGWGGVHAGILFQSVDALNEGNSTLDGDGNAFEAVVLTGGLTVKF